MEFLTARSVKSGWIGVVLSLLLLGGVYTPSGHAETAKREYALKAVFLYNFCQFIEWPPHRFESDKTPIVIGVLGANPFGSLLSETVEGEVVRGRNIHLEFYKTPAEAKKCHILFVSDEELARSPNVCTSLKGHHVVTVGESDAFLNRGGMIALTSEQNRIRVRIYLEAASGAQIEISSKLLRIADIKR